MKHDSTDNDAARDAGMIAGFVGPWLILAAGVALLLLAFI